MDKRGHIIDQKDFIWDQIFWDRDWDIFLRLFQNQIFETDTETVFLIWIQIQALAMYQDQSWDLFFKTAIETLCETKSFQSVTCISLEKDISTARTLRVIDCTLTFYVKYQDFFETITKTFFGDQYWGYFETVTRTFFRPNISETEAFFWLNFLETDTETFFRDQICWDRYQYSQKIEKKVSIPRGPDTRCHTLGTPLPP